jgi:hypothetical protein
MKRAGRRYVMADREWNRGGELDEGGEEANRLKQGRFVSAWQVSLGRLFSVSGYALGSHA